MIYVLHDGNHYKIGVGKNPAGRLRSFQTGNARPLTIVATITARDIYENTEETPEEELEAMCNWPWFERALHTYLWEHRVVGEWFNGSHPHVKAIVELLIARRPFDVAALIRADATFLLRTEQTDLEALCPLNWASKLPRSEWGRYDAIKRGQK
jgi:hypothetical protein